MMTPHAPPATLHVCAIDDRIYHFRTPTPFDLPNLSSALTRRRVRRPQLLEFKIVSLAGIDALGEMAEDPAEAIRQRGVIERWYELLEPISENDIDEPDFEARAAELARLQEEQAQARGKIFAEVTMIEANLARHFQPYADLLADRALYDQTTKIQVVRLLLVKRDGAKLPLDEHDMLAFPAYGEIPRADLPALEAFANGLLLPSGDREKN